MICATTEAIVCIPLTPEGIIWGYILIWMVTISIENDYSAQIYITLCW